MQMWNNLDWNKLDAMSDDEFNSEMGNMMTDMFSNLNPNQLNKRSLSLSTFGLPWQSKVWIQRLRYNHLEV